LIGVLDVRKRFGKPPKEHDDESCIIFIKHGDFNLGLIVDSVKETATIQEHQIQPPPSAKLNHINHYIRNIGRLNNEVKLLMDLDRFLLQD
jgi:purine-binding chemotaxis protein CheW